MEATDSIIVLGPGSSRPHSMSDLDFERIDLDPDMEEVRYEQKPDFAQVVFHNIAEMYPTDAHVVCGYTITSPLQATNRDWVGLYKVGWSSPRDFVFFLWSPIPKDYKPGHDAVNRVVFQSHCLPKDDGEFYQFCYVTSKGCVRGASTPFQFKRPSAEDYVEVEDGDIMMVKTRTAALEDNLTLAVEEKTKLEKQLRCLEKERDGLVDKLVANKKQLNNEKTERESLTQQLGESHERVNQLEREAESFNKVHQSLRDKLNTLNKEKAGVEKRIEEKDDYISSLQEKIKLLISEKDALMGKAKSLEQEKELFKNHFTTSESTMQKYLVTIDNQKRAMTEASQLTESLRANVESLTLQVNAERQQKEVMVTAVEKDKDYMVEAEERLRSAEDKLRASDEMVNMMKKETLAQIQVITKMSTDLEETKSEAHSLKLTVGKQEKDHKVEKRSWLDEKAELQANIKAQEKEIEHLWTKVETLSEQAKEAESRTSTDQGSLFALQTAQNHLKDRYTKMKEQHEQAVKQTELLNKKVKHHQQMESDLRHEVSDLKERLSMGAEEYKVKYLEARRLEGEIRKLNKLFKRSGSLSSSRASSESKQTETERLQQSDAGTTTPQKSTSETGTITLKRATSETGTVTPRQTTSETGTGTPKPATSETGTATPQTTTSETGTGTSQPTTSETGTTTPQPTTSEAGISAAAATAEASTSSTVSIADACTATPSRQTTEASTSAAAETAEASTSSWVLTNDAGTSSSVSTVDMGTHTKQATSEVGTTTKTHDALSESGASCPEATQGLLDDLLREIASKKVKLQKYKQLYHDEKEKIAFLQKHYYTELEKRDNELSAMQSSHQEEVLTLQTRIVNLEDMVDRSRSLDRSHSTEHRSGQVTPSSPPPLPPVVLPPVYSPHRPTLQMPPPFQTQPMPLTPPLFPLSHGNQVVDTQDGASAASAAVSDISDFDLHDGLEVLVAGPAELPAPIQPEVLPTAKMAAIKHANQGQLQGLNMFLGDSILSSDDDEGPPQILDPAELDEERFHDADGEPQKLCPACNMTFPAEFPQHMFEAHVDAHYGPICPMCNEQFEQGLAEEDFVTHVDRHFTD